MVHQNVDNMELYNRILNKIQYSINQNYIDFGKDITFIVMNTRLAADIILSLSESFPSQTNSLKLFGCAVYRSEDLEYHEFKIG